MTSMSTSGRIVVLADDLAQPPSVNLVEEICTIGRAEGCSIRVQHPLVSRLHARIERNGPRYLISDAGSVNGTFINGSRLRETHLLTHEDVIGLGSPRPVLRFIDPDPTALAEGVLRFDERAMVFFLGQEAVTLTPSQFKLLHFLYQHAGEVCSRESCARAIWGRDYEPGMDAGAFDQALNSLRSALRAAGVGRSADLIETRRGLGYVLHL